MLKTSTADAMMLLTQALHTLPSEPDPRSDFFVQWRNRTIETIERIFADDPAASLDFKEIEFSPRRLTRDAEKDEQLRLDACLAGCAQARLILERLISAVNLEAITLLEQAKAVAEQANASIETTQNKEDSMKFGSLCTSIAQVVNGKEIDDSASVLANSAQLLRNLSVGLADGQLRAVTERMMSKVAESPVAAPNWEHADVFVWSVLMALGELKRWA